MTSLTTAYRSDIEGLRAIAISLVLLYHAGVPFFGGGYVGVDVFFVLSGYLITGVMLRDVDRTGKLSLTAFWARRARRLLPAAFVALGAASLITWLWLPLTQRVVFGKDIFSAAVYLVNWRLAARSVDYLAEDIGQSPVQHFWSLAVEEQFYIIWPLVIVAALLIARRSKMSARMGMAIAIVAAVIASLAWSIARTSTDPIDAYFSTFTRFWEIGLGAVVALSAGYLARLPDRVLALTGWAGLGGVALSAVWFTELTPFPSYRALLPILGAALLVISGLRAVRGSPRGLLSTRPAVWLGGLSYSVYLWHWLVLVAAAALWGELSVVVALGVTAFSFVPAALVHRFIENPIRFGESMKRPRNALLVGAAFAIASALAGVLVVVSVPHVAAPVATNETEPNQAAATNETEPNQAPATNETEPNQAAVEPNDGTADRSTPDSAQTIVPDPLLATGDGPDAYAGGCQVGESSVEVRRCVYGAGNSDKTLMLIGDSKAVQWEPAFQLIAERSGWRLEVMGKSGCVFSEADQIRKGERYTACREWNDAVMQVIQEETPDLVVTSGFTSKGLAQTVPDDTPQTLEAMATGYAERWRQLTEMGIPVVVLLDNPNPQSKVYECVAQNRDALSECAFELEPAIEKSGALALRAAADMPGVDVTVIDLTERICPNECPAVIDGILLYRQSHHLTRTYVESLVPDLSPRLAAATDGQLAND